MRTNYYHILTSIAIWLCPFLTNAQDIATVESSSNVLEDGNIELIFDFSIENGWYMYNTTPIKGGPMPCTFDITPSPDFEIVGKLTDADKAHTKIDPGFRIEVEYFEMTARFRQLIRPLTDKKFTVEGTLNYQTCDGRECLINDTEISITIDPNAKPNGAAIAKGLTQDPAPIKEGNNGDSLLIFLLIAFAAGLGGVITPCVFPMIPMTVGFFIGGGSSKRGGIMKGLIFGISVILIYTILGLIVALFQSTSATDALGTHWIPNLIFALLFLVFAISFFGAFEITLPNGLANKADRQADKGGYVAAFFVAFAMVIVSFSCTGPFVGSILAAAVVGGVALKPILGMAVFGFAFALPFVIFSFFPGIMKKLPKSGGWLNVVKVVFAFVMLAFALKFFYNVDAYFGWEIITRLGFLTIWIAISILLALYFLGIIRTSHDSPLQGIGWGRIFAATACITFALYMIPGLFGAPLKTISGLIPPQDGSTMLISSSAGTSTSVSGYSSLPSYHSVEEALKASENDGKPILLSFKSQTCSVCKVMESTVLNDAQVLEILKDRFVIANLYVDDKTPDSEYKTLGKRLRKYETDRFGSASQPLYVIIDSQENILSGPIGSCSLEEYLNFLNY